MDDESRTIFIELSVATVSQEDAAKVIDTFSRMVLGLALDGFSATLEVTAEEYYVEMDEIEEDQEEGLE